MEQTTIFDYIGFERDHLFIRIKEMGIGEVIQDFDSVIRFETKGYEIENEFFHEGFLTFEECYHLLKEFINKM